MEVTSPTQTLVNTFEYIKQLVEIRYEPAYSLKEYGHMRIHEIELDGLPGIVVFPEQVDESVIWLEVKRLRRMPPPAVPDSLFDWVDLIDDFITKPELKEEIMVTVTKEVAQGLLERGTARKENVLQSPREQDARDIRLLSEDNPGLSLLFDDYIEKHWLPWAVKEKPIRNCIKIYEKLFEVHQLMNAGEAERPLELVWGIGHAFWDVPASEKIIEHPLIELLVELDLDRKNQSIYIRPRGILNDKARLNLDAYEALGILGVKELKESFDQHLESLDRQERSLDPSDLNSFDLVLRSAVTRLDKNARYWPNVIDDVSNRQLPNISVELTITDTWVIFARPKRSNSLSDDIQRLQRRAESINTLPDSAVSKFVSEPSTARGPSGMWQREHDTGGWNQASSQSSTVVNLKSREIYFPKPSNNAQKEIIERLEKNVGVVVQGPPGTGKTHTIANIICHYLATGRRVLVTAKSETALNVLKDQIPIEIQPLVIALVSNDQEGLRQQRTAIEALQNRVVTLQGKERRLSDEIANSEKHIVELKARLESLEAEVFKIAKQQLERVETPFTELGFECAKELAEWLVEYRDSYRWFPDTLSIGKEYEPQFDNNAIARFIEAKENVGEEIKSVDKAIPQIANLLSVDTFEQIHKDLVHHKQLKAVATNRDFPRLKLPLTEVLDKLEVLNTQANNFAEWHSSNISTWNYDLFSYYLEQYRGNSAWLEVLSELLEDLELLLQEDKKFLRWPVMLNTSDAKEIAYIKEAAHRQESGKSVLSPLNFFNSKAKQAIHNVTVPGMEKTAEEFWFHIWNYFLFRDKCVELANRWNVMAQQSPMVAIPVEEPLPSLKEIHASSLRAKDEATALEHCSKLANSLFGLEVDTRNKESIDSFLGNVKRITQHHLSVLKLNDSIRQQEQVNQYLKQFDGLRVEAASTLITSELGNPRAEISTLREKWKELLEYFARLSKFSSSFQTIDRICDQIRNSGAPKWAKQLTESPISIEEKSRLLTWSEAWRFKRLNSLFNEIDNHERLISIESERRQIEKKLNLTFEEIVRNKTYLELCSSMSDLAKAGLAKFTAAISRIGRGTGKKAPYFIRAAQKAMVQCAGAVPCWIMPSWRVSEVFPSEFGYFDLVIVDEASQCDIRELPAIARGKQVLIVGDDQQVSPTPEFIDHNKFLQLKHNYLGNQPFGEMMLPDYSLYDLAGAVYSGNKIILNEHFRCVEPIIRFSFQFYKDHDGKDRIQPLRVSKPSERIEPPLVDILVEDGNREGDINPAEAKVIVKEIETLSRDSNFVERTIGVIALIGKKQAEYIQRLLLEHLGQEIYMRHEIVCGNAATFQGREKDIIFLSMVESKSNRSISKLTKREYQQRYNVASSRARDRMYLVRSVMLEHLAQDDLRAKLLRHFQKPMPQKHEISQELLEQCQSPFEKEVFKNLVEAGYHVRPQVPCMGRSIDLVVEGAGDARLAIELDGDSYHGPEKWLEDWNRQKSLERFGWKFWRCWYSSFVADKAKCMQSLFNRLESENILPTQDIESSTLFTEFRKLTSTNDQKAEDAECMLDVGQSNHACVEIGDQILLRSNFENRSISLSLVETIGEPEKLIFGPDHKVSERLIGCRLDDELDLFIEGKEQRVAVVEMIKAKQLENRALESVNDHLSSVDSQVRLNLKETALTDSPKLGSDVEKSDNAPANVYEAMDLSRAQLKKVILKILENCPNNSCVKDKLPNLILKEWGIRSRGAPLKDFSRLVNKYLAYYNSYSQEIEVYHNSKNIRVRIKRKLFG